MKKISKKTYLLAAILSFFVFGTAGISHAQEAPKPAKSEVKAAVLKAETDFDKAYEAAKKEGKKLMLEFAGLDWCPPCKMLHKFVVGTDEFAKYANEKLHVVLADFKRGGEPADRKNAKKMLERHLANLDQALELAEKYRLRYFPTIVIINPKTDKVKILEGLQTKTPQELIEVIETFDK